MFLSQGQLTALQVLAVLGNGAAVVGLGIAVVRSLGASDWGPAVVTCIDCGAELMTAHIEESFRKRRNKVRQVVVEHGSLETCYGELRHGAEA